MNPITPTIKTEILPLLFIIMAIISSFYFYNVFPEQVPIHWNLQGEVDNYGSKAMGAFLFPFVTLGMYLLFLFLPLLDPKKEKYEQFKRPYHIIKFIMVMFMLLMYYFTALNAIGFNISIGTWVPVMVGCLFLVIGNYLSKVKSNWFLGIRNPWTLSSEENWRKTHRVAARIFVLGGFLMMLMPFYPEKFVMPIFIVIILMLAFGTNAYSLFLHLKNTKKHENN